MEAWVSGLYQQSWKLPNMRVFREFESHRFRQVLGCVQQYFKIQLLIEK
jgi:hypothetical protein